jgi:hypothetical protein
VKLIVFIATVLFFPFNFALIGQENNNISFQGQASAWVNVNSGSDLPLWMGGRYIPQINFNFNLEKDRLFDFEVAANINGNAATDPFHAFSTDGVIKPYRAWMRYSGNQYELRLGLQKINFGSATMLRPLMWFDKMDPRDPLQLTDGVWALLGRYYFLNNANIWLWTLYGNKDPKTWETTKTTTRTPEVGGRIQLPVPKGETAFTFHHRSADTRRFEPFYPGYEKVPESRYGIDGKWDLEVGLWLEAVIIHKHKDTGPLTNQQMFSIGMDYTFGIGNGLNMIGEHLLFSPGQKIFEFDNPVHFSGLSVSYPTGIFSSVSSIVYYDWTHKNSYNFLNWRNDFKKISLYLMAFWNPETFQLPQQTETGTLFSGRGLQLMLVYNH